MSFAKSITGYRYHAPLHMLLLALLGLNGYTIQLLDKAGYGSHAINESVSYLIVLMMVIVVITGVAPSVHAMWNERKESGETA